MAFQIVVSLPDSPDITQVLGELTHMVAVRGGVVETRLHPQQQAQRPSIGDVVAAVHGDTPPGGEGPVPPYDSGETEVTGGRRRRS